MGGLLLGAAYPPLDLGPLSFVAVAPLLWAWRGARPRRAALYGFVFGIAFFAFLLEWSRYFGAVAIAPLVLAEAAYLAGAGALVAAFERRGLRSPALTAAIWVVFESLRGRWPLGGFPWGELGVSLHDFPPARALASFGGVALVSFLLIVVNGLLVDAVTALRAGYAPRRRPAGHCAAWRPPWSSSSPSSRSATCCVTTRGSPATSSSRSCRATTRTAT